MTGATPVPDQPYFSDFTKATEGMQALSTIGDVQAAKIKPLDAKDIIQLTGDRRTRRDANSAADSRATKTQQQLLDQQKTQITSFASMDVTALNYDNSAHRKIMPPGLRFCCYLPNCAYSANDAREMRRHFAQFSPRIHEGIVYEPNKVFDVVHGDWMSDKDLVCTAKATDTRSWYDAFEVNNFGPNRMTLWDSSAAPTNEGQNNTGQGGQQA